MRREEIRRDERGEYRAPGATVAAVVAWSALYALAFGMGLLFADPRTRVSAIWVPSGVALAAALSASSRVWRWFLAAVLVVALCFRAARHEPLFASLLFMLPNLAEAIVGRWVMRRWLRERITFERVDEVVALGGVALLAAGLSATLGATLAVYVGGAQFWPSFRLWWVANALGIVITTPLLIAWRKRPEDAPRREGQARRLETLTFGLIWAGFIWFIVTERGATAALSPRPYMLLCMLPWAALRLGLRSITTALAGLAAAMLAWTLIQTPSFDFSWLASDAEPLVQAQIFLVLVALTGLLLFAGTMERRVSAEAEQRSAQLVTFAFDSARLGAWEWDIPRAHIDWSDGVAHTFGLEPGTFDGKFETFIGCLHEADRARTLETIERSLREVPEYETEFRVVRPDGDIRTVSVRGRVHRDEAGVPVRMAGTTLDITREREVEAELRQAQKMEAIGQLAGGVAHDFNNVLAVILLQAETLRGRLPAAERGLVDELSDAARRGSSMTKRLLAVARKQVLEPTRLDLNAVVRDHVALLEPLLAEKVTLEVRVSSEPLAVRADASMLGQVLMNLAVNARDAMPHGGRLDVETRAVTVTEPTPTVDRTLEPGRYAVLRVADTGTGIPEQELSRIFEPFYTTKPEGVGTGLGLATVLGIAKTHGAAVRVASIEGRGTTFEVFFRLLDAENAPARRAPADGASAASPTQRSRAILLVEDDAGVRRTTRWLLEASGLEVIEAFDSASALEQWREHGERIGLLLTDMVMPGEMNGRELAERLRAERPSLRVVLVTGYTAESVGASHAVDRVFMKPVTPDELTAAIGELLTAEPSAAEAC